MESVALGTINETTTTSDAGNEITSFSRDDYTCCVPLCYNNSKRNRELHFYVIPKNRALRKVWLNKISRKNFKPGKGHRVCSAHFEGGQKKTYDNNIPTIVPKTNIQSRGKERTSRNSFSLKSTNEPFGPNEDNDSNTGSNTGHYAGWYVVIT